MQYTKFQSSWPFGSEEEDFNGLEFDFDWPSGFWRENV